MVFVDTGAWFARLVPSDPNHLHVKRWLDSNTQPLVTTDYCADETLTLLAARTQFRRAAEFGRALLESRIAQLHFITPDQFACAFILFQQHATAGRSFTDCTSKVVFDGLGIQAAVAFDDHFHQFGVAVAP